ncbi:hypothetical protein HX785_02220 [Pseudomonas reactans]|uniref:hypothetical protein n=1 Tax=Pseudomonas reactans TaxID=117680 RepID=UPI0015A1EE42|nr:hypothetical protein [Pseudomonas reactans]NWF12487.1 hypothetical protein [Pseudomonas reactans]
MSIENLMVTLNRLPELNLNSSTDWVAVCSFAATAVVVAVGAFYNAYVFKGTVKGQENIAKVNFEFLKEQSKAEFLAKSRLKWVETLRDEVSLFLSLGASVQAVAQFIVNTDWMVGLTPDEIKQNQELYSLRYSEFTSALAKGRMHFSKVELLLNLNNKDEEVLMQAMSDYILAAAKSEAINHLGTDVTIAARKILMREWDSVKSMAVI